MLDQNSAELLRIERVAADASRAARCAPRPAAPAAPAARRLGVSYRSRTGQGERSLVRSGLSPAQPGRRSSNSGRAVATMRSGTPLTRSTSSSTKSRRASSAQCKSSKTSTSRRSRASASRKCRHAANISPRRSAEAACSPPSPRRAPKYIAMRSASAGSSTIRCTALRSLRSTFGSRVALENPGLRLHHLPRAPRS